MRKRIYEIVQHAKFGDEPVAASTASRNGDKGDFFALGIDVGGTTTKLGLFDGEGKLLKKNFFDSLSVQSDSSFVPMARGCSRLLEQAGVTSGQIGAVGLVVPGPVVAGRSFVSCPNLDLDLRAYEAFLHEEFPAASVSVFNDAAAAGLGDFWQGSAHQRGCKDFILITLGTGVGAGVISHGEILSGSNGAAGEIGHLCVDPIGGVLCGCGRRGCLEQYASAKALVRMAGECAAAQRCITDPLTGNISSAPTSSADAVTRAPTAYPDAKSVFDAAEAGDASALAAIEIFSDRLAFGLAQVACTLDPRLFVLGGGVSAGSPLFLETVRTRYKDYAFEACRHTEIVVSNLGNDCGIYGAVYGAIHSI